MIHSIQRIVWRRLFLDFCVGVALGLFFGGAWVAMESPQLGAYMMIASVAVSAIGQIVGGAK